MSYELALLPEAEREWKALDGSVRQIFKKQLQKCLETPRIPKNQLSGYKDYYKIKLTRPQCRLVYHVDDSKRRLTIVATGSRQDIYSSLQNRQSK
jgi:mRNA interferase RelE/StbE